MPPSWRPTSGPLAVTGASGRLGRAILRSARRAGITTMAWDRPQYDLDRPDAAVPLLRRDQPSLVIGSAAMTDVDGCARQPDLAMRRNASAVAELAGACADQGVGFVLVSTNEVFDGERQDGRPYTELDTPRPRNPYGASKFAGEEAARAAYDGAAGLWIVRTAWLYGPPGNDFPAKIEAASDRLEPGTPLPVVADEFGSPTYVEDLAAGIIDLVRNCDGGLFHLVNPGSVSRLEWAERVLRAHRPYVKIYPAPPHISRLTDKAHQSHDLLHF